MLPSFTCHVNMDSLGAACQTPGVKGVNDRTSWPGVSRLLLMETASLICFV